MHVSTDEVYGSIPHGSWPETHPLEPNSPYSASKASSDLLARAYHRTHGLPVCITRCSNNYGPHQFPEKVIPLFVTNLLDGGTVPLYGDGLNVRDWLHVDDHCRGIALVAGGGPPGRGLQHRRRHRADEPRAHLPPARRPRRGRVHDRAGGRPARATTAATPSTGPRSPTSWATRRRCRSTTGLAETVDWYTDHRAWWEPLKAGAAVAMPMKATELPIAGAWVFEPTRLPRRRGRFAAPFQGDAFREALGFDLHVAQVNQSVSARGVIRGVHFADVPPGQAKYVYCARGRAARRGRRRPGGLADLRAGRGGRARRASSPGGLPGRGSRARVRRARGRHGDDLPVLHRLPPRRRTRHPPARPRTRACPGPAGSTRSCRTRTPQHPRSPKPERTACCPPGTPARPATRA